jgi:hypothetical protein
VDKPPRARWTSHHPRPLPLRQATLKQSSDSGCARAFAHNRPGTGERFNAARMVCGIDPDGRQPLSSGCFGDSGVGDKCGADHSPSVFADVAHYRSFIADPSPAWTA